MEQTTDYTQAPRDLMPTIDVEAYGWRISQTERKDNSFDNLFLTKHAHKDQSGLKRKVVISGHRGGF